MKKSEYVSGDELLLKLNYIKKEDKFGLYGEKWGECFYNKNNLVEITFDIEDKEIALYCFDGNEAIYLDKYLLQALSQKAKEFRFLKGEKTMTKELQNTIIINNLIEKLQEIKNGRIDSVDIEVNSRYEEVAKMVDGTIYMKNYLDISIIDNKLIERKEPRI